MSIPPSPTPNPSPKTQVPKPVASTKVVPPRSTGRIVEREELIAQLLEARRHRCVVIQGPAGCGKTSILVAWRKALLPLGFDVAWLTLTPEDNEPTRLLDYLIESFAQVDPAIPREAAELAGHGISSAAIEHTVVALVRGIARHQRDLVLVLDDLQHLGDTRIHEALQWLLDYSPSNLHLVLASRSSIPLSLARLRAQKLLLELDLRDLRFSPAESERFLRAQLGTIEHSDAVLLHELTDGWVAGLQLYAIGWKKLRQQSGDGAKVPGNFMRSHVQHVQDARTFASYFDREVLSHLAPPELEFLISASACSRFCAPLCAALAGRPDAIADVVVLLSRLEADNLFIISIQTTERDTWYRLHPLLRETLSERFSRRSISRQRHVHLAAWNWFRDRGLLDEAVRHAVQADESAAAAQLIEKSAYDLAVRGDLRRLIGLVRQLPLDQVQSRPQLQLWMIRVELYANDFDTCIASIRRLRVELPENDVVNRFALVQLQASLAVHRDDTDAAMALLPQLLQTPEQADVMTVGSRDNILSWLYLHRGEYERARQVQFDNPSRLIDGVPLLGTSSGTLQGRCMVGLSYVMQGQMTQAERIYRDVLHEAELGGGACDVPAHLATAFLGQMLYELNEPQAVLQLLEPRVDVLERVSMPDSVLRLLYMLSASHWVIGQKLESFAYLERLEDYATDRGLDRLLAYSLAAQAQRRLELGELESTDTLLQRLDVIESRHTEAEQATYNEASNIAARVRIRRLLVLGDLDVAAERLDLLISRLESRGRKRLVAQLLLLRAVIESRQGRPATARDYVVSALELGHRLGLLRSLLDTDPTALELIREVGTDPSLDPVLAFYAEKLCAPALANAGSEKQTSTAATRTTTPVQPIEALSERELDVVRLLAQALPNKKIARTLGLSPETVKWHLKNIYGKLGVSSRDDAVARVRDHQWGDNGAH